MVCGEPVWSTPSACHPNTDPTHYHYYFLTTALGMPITKEVVKDVYRRILFFFHENKDKKGNTSNRVLVSI